MGIRATVSAVTIVTLISTTTSAQERPLILQSREPPTRMASPAMLGAGIGVVTLGSLATTAGVVMFVMMSNASPRCLGDLCAVTSEGLTPLAAASIGTGLTALIAGAIMIAGRKPVALSEASMPMRWTF